MPVSPPHQQEHTNYASGSSGQHTTPAVPPIPSTSSILPPPMQPITFNGTTYRLPVDLAARLANAPPLYAPPQRRGRRPTPSIIAPTPVSFNNLCLFIL